MLGLTYNRPPGNNIFFYFSKSPHSSALRAMWLYSSSPMKCPPTANANFLLFNRIFLWDIVLCIDNWWLKLCTGQIYSRINYSFRLRRVFSEHELMLNIFNCSIFILSLWYIGIQMNTNTLGMGGNSKLKFHN